MKQQRRRSENPREKEKSFNAGKPARDNKGSKDNRTNKDSRFNKDSRINKDNRFEKDNRGIREKKVISKEIPVEQPKAQVELREDIIEGRNAVIEALRSERTIEQIFVAQGDVQGSINVVLGLAKEKGIVVKEVDRRKLDQMSETGSHQGVIAMVTPYNYFGIDEILMEAVTRGENPFIVILDEIEDPHNFGSIIRTAEVCGAHGIIIPKRRNVGVTPTVYKTSAGAVEHMKIAKVTNINSVIDMLKEKGIWVYGADMSGERYCFDVKFGGPMALIIGSEGKGISKLTRDKCDVLVKIPMMGKITSLNASVAGGIMMYEVLKQKVKRG